MPTAYLGGVPLQTSPEEIRWDFTMKVVDHKTLGGKVIQVLGTTLGDMTVSGRFGYGPKRQEPWQQMLAMRERIKAMTKKQYEEGAVAKPVRFVYAPRNWDFPVYVKQLSPQPIDIRTVAPTYSITLHIEDEGARRIVKGIEDAYIKRLMDGVGWKQSAYNGPQVTDIEATLNGRTVGEYLADEVQEVFDRGLPGGSIGPGEDTGVAPEGAIPGVTP